MRTRVLNLIMILSLCFTMCMPTLVYASEIGEDIVIEETVEETEVEETEVEETVEETEVEETEVEETVEETEVEETVEETEVEGTEAEIPTDSDAIEVVDVIDDEDMLSYDDTALIESINNLSNKMDIIIEWLTTQDVQNYIMIFLVGVIVLCLFMKR